MARNHNKSIHSSNNVVEKIDPVIQQLVDETKVDETKVDETKVELAEAVEETTKAVEETTEAVEETTEAVEETTKAVEETTDSSLLSTLVENLVDETKEETKEEKELVEELLPSEKNQGVGIIARRLITEGKSNKDVLAEIHKRFGNTRTTYACIAWYRNDMKKKKLLGKAPVKSVDLTWIQDFAKKHGLGEEQVEELKQKVAA